MKPLFLAALVALAASPALAASHRHHARVTHHAARVHHWTGAYSGHYTGAYSGPYGVSRPVYRSGYYLGADPDPNVRFELWRDPPFGRK